MTLQTAKPILAIDGDGVIFDYATGYINVWEHVFGWRPQVINPNAVMVTDKFGVPHLEGEELEAFREAFPKDFWATLPWLPGVEEACRKLSEKFTLVCVTAIPNIAVDSRRKNLEGLNFSDVIATPTGMDYNRHHDISPKAGALSQLKPVAFFDDYLPFHFGVDKSITQVLIQPEGIEPPVGWGEHVDFHVPSLLEASKRFI